MVVGRGRWTAAPEPGGRSLFVAMLRRHRENLALLLFFPALAYVVFRGWDRFAELGYRGAGWWEIVVPSVLMTLALYVVAGAAARLTAAVLCGRPRR